LISALESNGFQQLADLFGIVKLKDRDIPANLNFTVLAPTDQVCVNTSALGLLAVLQQLQTADSAAATSCGASVLVLVTST
jgi:hypothetical protein